MVAPVHFDPKILPKGSAFTMGAAWARDRGKKKALNLGGPSSIDFAYFWGSNYKQRSCDGQGGGAQRPVWCGNELKKTGARSAWARTRGQNTLVVKIRVIVTKLKLQ